VSLGDASEVGHGSVGEGPGVGLGSGDGSGVGLGVGVGVGVGSVGEGVGVALGSVGEGVGVGVGGPSVGAQVSARDDGVVGSTWATARPPSASPNAAVDEDAGTTTDGGPSGPPRRHATRSGLDNDGISSVTLLDPIALRVACGVQPS
jgi:hypothetical protein